MKFLLIFLALVLFIYVLFLIFIFLSVRKNIKWFKSPPTEGKFADFHSKKIFYRVKGKGEPVIVIINEIGSSQSEWWPIQNELGQKYRVITWDRVGYGWSSAEESPRTASNIANDLDSILKFEKVKKPVFLIANGTATLYARYYSSTRPYSVRGCLFINPIPIKYKLWIDTINEMDECPNIFESAIKKKKYATRGFYRIFVPFKGYKLDKRYKRDITEHYSRSEHYETMQLEYSEILNSISEINLSDKFPPIPLKILNTSNEGLIREMIRKRIPEYSARQLGRLYNELSSDILNLSPKSSHLEIGGTGEYIHLSKPDIIVRETLNMLS